MDRTDRRLIDLRARQLLTHPRNVGRIRRPRRRLTREEPMPDLRTDLLRENHGDPIEAAAIFAVRLMRDDPAICKVGYSLPNALLAATELFPEVDPVAIGVRMEQIHPGTAAAVEPGPDSIDTCPDCGGWGYHRHSCPAPPPALAYTPDPFHNRYQPESQG